jgi:DegV family protein with EDD domain
MPNVCILTDSTAQFTQTNFPGRERVYVIPFELEPIIRNDGESVIKKTTPKTQLIPPSPHEFSKFYEKLSGKYDSIMVLPLSSMLSPVMQNAIAGAKQSKTNGSVQIIDSQTTCIGLGMLVQKAANTAVQGASLKEIEQTLRTNIPRVYMMFCLPELTTLAYSGYIEYSQALIAEMMGMLPLFSFEEGRLEPVEKVRTPRHLNEAFQEFIGEFEMPEQIALVRSPANGSLSTSQLRQFVEGNFPRTMISEHSMQPHVESLFGQRSLGLALMDSV